MRRARPAVTSRITAHWAHRFVLLGASLVFCGGSICGFQPSLPFSSGRPDERRRTQGEAPADPPPASRIQLPFPGLDALEPSVIELLQATRARAERALAGDLSSRDLAEELGSCGMTYHAHALREIAMACYREAHRRAPQQLRWVYYPAIFDSDPERRLNWFRLALEREPTHVPSLIRSARLLHETNRLDLAEERYRKAIRLDSNRGEAHAGLGRIAADRKQYRVAIEHFERALQIEPGATILHYPLGLAYRSLGEMDQARKHLRLRGSVNFPARDPLKSALDGLRGGMRLHQNDGAASFLQGLFEQARVSFQKAVAVDPKSVLARTNLASSLVQLGRFDEAVDELRFALDLAPDHAMANFNWGTLRSRFGYDKEAVRAYARALASNPDQVEARFNQANALRRLARFDEAAKAYERVTRDDPGRRDAWLGLILSHGARNDYSAACEVAEKSVRIFPKDSVMEQALARLLATGSDEHRDGSRALQISQSLIEREKSLSNYECLAMALAEVGRLEEAIRLQKILIDRASQAGRSDLVTALQDGLSVLNSGRPLRRPWSRFDSVLRPRTQRDSSVPDPFRAR